MHCLPSDPRSRDGPKEHAIALRLRRVFAGHHGAMKFRQPRIVAFSSSSMTNAPKSTITTRAASRGFCASARKFPPATTTATMSPRIMDINLAHEPCKRCLFRSAPRGPTRWQTRQRLHTMDTAPTAWRCPAVVVSANRCPLVVEVVVYAIAHIQNEA